MLALNEVPLMSDLMMLSRAQMYRIEPYFPLSMVFPEWMTGRF